MVGEAKTGEICGERSAADFHGAQRRGPQTVL